MRKCCAIKRRNGDEKMRSKKPSGKLLKYVVKENGKVLMELLPTKTNEKKAINMAHMAGIEVIRVFDQ